jgi:hypothetical protein
MTHRTVIAFALVASMLISSVPARAQTQQTLQPKSTATPAQGTPPPVLQVQDSADARVTRERLHELLRQYPPSVGEVLGRDPSLLSRPDYLAPYAELVAFLQQHPEVVRNPSYYFGAYGSSGYRFEQYRSPEASMLETVMEMLSGGAIIAAFLSVFIWLVRTVVDYRRWLRQSRIQVDVHTKLLDRMTAHEDLVAYIQSPAGSRFLQSAPIALDGEAPRSGGAPLSRVIWSMQAGIVLLALGIGIWALQWSVIQEVAAGFRVMGTIAMALGAGFVLSAVAAYMMSVRFGLLTPQKSS